MPPIATLLPPRKASAAPFATIARASLTNLSGLPTRAWVPVGIPIAASGGSRETTFLTDRGLWLRASRAWDEGSHTSVWMVFAPLGGRQTIAGALLVPDGEVQDQGFVTHPWVGDDMQTLIPHVRAVVGGKIQDQGVPQTLELVDCVSGRGAMQRWHFIEAVPGSGLVAEGDVSFYSGSPIADVDLFVGWSDRTDPEPIKDFDGIAFGSGEYVAFDDLERVGVPFAPILLGTQWVQMLTGGAIRMKDGSGICLTARMLCLPQKDWQQYATGEWAEDLDALKAALFGPVVGLADGRAWDGRFLAHRNIPRIAPASAPAEVQAAVDQLDAFEKGTDPGSWYGPRMVGCSPTPGQTGDQEDFGSAKGFGALVAQDARWPRFARFSAAADAFRGFAHYEGGKRLDPAAHPDWTTWSMATHFSASQSPDRLGKRDPTFAEWAALAWIGYDNQHRSQNNLAASLALTGRPVLRHLLECASVVDIANVLYRRDQGSDAARAVGRLGLTYANSILLTRPGSVERQRYMDLQKDMLRQFQRDWMGGKYAQGVDVLDLILDAREGVTWNGEAVACWSPFQHGLLASGVYAMWKVTRDQSWLDVAKRVARNLVKNAWFLSDADGMWWCPYAVAWVTAALGAMIGEPTLADGDPLPRPCYQGSTLVAGKERDGTATWSFLGPLIYCELADVGDPDLPRARAIVKSISGDAEATDKKSAEWWACVRQVPPVPGDWRKYEAVAL